MNTVTVVAFVACSRANFTFYLIYIFVCLILFVVAIVLHGYCVNVAELYLISLLSHCCV